MKVAPNLWVTKNFYKKCLPAITQIKVIIKASCINDTLGKDFFAAATFKGLQDVSFQSKKVCSML